MASAEASSKTYYLACHCQANILSLTVPLTPTPTLGNSSAPVGVVADTDTDVRHGGEADTEKAEAEAEAEVEAEASEGGQWDKARTVGGTTEEAGIDASDGVSNDPSTSPHANQGAGLEGAMICDCSICLKRLSVFSIQPVERVRFIKGCGVEGGGGKGEGGMEDGGGGTMKVYQFGEKKGSHCVSRSSVSLCQRTGVHENPRARQRQCHHWRQTRARGEQGASGGAARRDAD